MDGESDEEEGRTEEEQRSSDDEDNVGDEWLCVDESEAAIRASGASVVALQLPAWLLPRAWTLTRTLEDRTGAEVFIMADTSYGECCVDEVTAEHVDAQLVLHYGHACLSPTRSLAVRYIVPQFAVRLQLLQRAVDEVLSAHRCHCAVIVPELPFVRALVGLETRLRGAVVARPPVELSEVVTPDSARRPAEHAFFGAYVLPEGAAVDGKAGDGDENFRTPVLWVGDAASPTLLSAIMGRGGAPVAVWRPPSPPDDGDVPAVDLGDGAATAHSARSVHRRLARRNALVERVRRARRVGVVAGTLSIRGQNEMVQRCMDALARAGRHGYVLSVGRPTAIRLANFEELEAFVLVACAESSLLALKELPQPVITPLELFLALSADELSGGIDAQKYSARFADAPRLAADAGAEARDDDDDDDDADAYGDENGRERSGDAAQRTLSKRFNESALLDVRRVGGAADFLRRRQWRGLEYETPPDASVQLMPGRSGRAMGYEGEGAPRAAAAAAASAAPEDVEAVEDERQESVDAMQW